MLPVLFSVISVYSVANSFFPLSAWSTGECGEF